MKQRTINFFLSVATPSIFEGCHSLPSASFSLEQHYSYRSSENEQYPLQLKTECLKITSALLGEGWFLAFLKEG